MLCRHQWGCFEVVFIWGMREIWISCPCSNDEFRKLFEEQAGLFFFFPAGDASGIQINKSQSRESPARPCLCLPGTPGQHRSLASVVEQGLSAQICVFHPPDSFTAPTPSHKPGKGPSCCCCILSPPALTQHLSRVSSLQMEPAQENAAGFLQSCHIWDQGSGKKPSGSSHTSQEVPFPSPWRNLCLQSFRPGLSHSSKRRGLCCTPALGRAHCYQ